MIFNWIEIKSIDILKDELNKAKLTDEQKLAVISAFENELLLNK